MLPLIAFDLGLALVFFILGSAASYALFATVGLHQLGYVAMLAGLAISMVLAAERRRVAIGAGVVLCAVLAGWIACWYFDVFWDGVAYHQDGIVNIARFFGLFWLDVPGHYTELTTHYPKVSWLYGAAIYSSVGEVQAAKSINGLLLAAVLLIAPAALRDQRVGLRVLFTIVLALNPIAASQFFTTMVDGAMAQSLTLLALGLYALSRNTLPPGKAAALIGAAALLAAGLKFTGMVFGCIGLAFALAIWVRRESSGGAGIPRSLRACGAALLAGLRRPRVIAGGVIAALLLANPYLTHLVNGKHIFHPAMGAEKQDLLGGQSTPDFMKLDPPSKLLLSVFSKSENLGPWSEAQLPTAKIPFVTYPDEHMTFSMVETRIAGWGPLFGGVLLCALILALSRPDALRGFGAVLLFLLVISVVSPESWWARFNPQLATLVVFALLAISGASRLHRAATILLALLLLANTWMVFRPMHDYLGKMNNYLAQRIVDLAARAEGPVYWDMSNFHMDLVFDRLGVKYASRTAYGGDVELVCANIAPYPDFPEDACIVERAGTNPN